MDAHSPSARAGSDPADETTAVVVPVIDIGPLLADPDGAPAVVDAMHAAALDTGFFVVVGHGLDTRLDELFGSAHRFFDLPQADKESVPRIERYGFVPQRDLAIDTDRLLGNTEYLDMGLVAGGVGPDDTAFGAGVTLPAIPGLAEAVHTYQLAALEVGRTIMRGLARALGAEPDMFVDCLARPQCRLRFLHYPPAPLLPDGSRPVPTTPHTDYGAITLLATDGVPGLEVRPVGGQWCPVDAPAGSLVVNLGDMLARWTNDRYVSTPHRVVGSPDRHRYSIPFFVNPDPDTVVACLPSCVTHDRPCAYEPVTAGEFLAMRIDGNAEPYVDPQEGPARAYTP